MTAPAAPDVLGPEYEAITLPMGEDEEGEVIATLVRRRAPEPTRQAVLYVHGFTDYFFQTHMADHFVAQGIDFYALDLRKYGRSLLPHQTPALVRSLTHHFPRSTRRSGSSARRTATTSSPSTGTPPAA